MDPKKGRLFKFDFPSSNFWVKIFFSVGGSQSQKDPPPLINKVCLVHTCSNVRQSEWSLTPLQHH